MAHEHTRRRSAAKRAVEALPPVALRALLLAGKRRKIIDDHGEQQLKNLCAQSGVTTTTEIRRLLLDGHMQDVGKALARLLPTEDAKQIGGYPLLAHLADGGMGQVWLTNAPDGISFCVLKCSKSLEKDNVAAVRLRRRFEREAAVHRRLHHPNVLRCIDSGVSELGVCYMVLEFISTGDLDDLVSSRGPVPESVALDIAYQVVDGLSEAHRIRLVHRDIKPGNIFISENGVAKLSDFGVAREDGEGGTQLTMSGTVLGSPYYMSPEQVNAGEDVDIRADIYAIGGMLCFCLTGQPPFPGRPLEAMHGHVKTPAPDLSRTYEMVSKATAEIILKCMSKDRGQRYANPLDLRAAIVQARSSIDDQDLYSWIKGDEVDNGESMASDETLPPGAMLRAIDTPASLTANVAPNASPIRFREPEELLALAAGLVPRSLASSRIENPLAVSKRLSLDPSVATWLVLVDKKNPQSVIHLFAKESLTIGKLAKDPVDITALMYPIAKFADICNRVSRSHCIIHVGDVGFTVMDLGSANGTELDGRMISPQVATSLKDGRSSRLRLAGSIDLEVLAVPRRSVDAAPNDLLEGVNDALVISRSNNRQELVYLLVRRRVLLGGLGADVVVPQGIAAKGIEIVLSASGWKWRKWQTGGTAGTWEKMQDGGRIVGAGIDFDIHSGTHGFYTS